MKTDIFKKQYPRQYQHLLNLYGGKFSNGGLIHDVQAAIYLYINNLPHPICEICNKKVVIGKKFRDVRIKNIRCAEHINSDKIYTLDYIKEKNIHNYTILDIDNEYIVGTTYITLHCEKHNHTYKQQVKNFIDGMKCQKCYHEDKLPLITFDTWKNKCNIAHNYKYDYSKVEYTDTSSNVTIICPEHGLFIQNAGVHSRGHGCKKCSFNGIYKQDYFLNKAKNIHNNKYNYSKVNYTGARNPVTINCPIHGNFTQIAYYHLAGNGCPTCGIENTTYKSKAEYEIIEFLEKHNIKCIHSNRQLGFEIDILLPEFNIGIEYNGIYWHSSNNKNDDAKFSIQHLFKTEICEDNNIQLFHMLDIEWNNPIQKEIWKSMLLVNCNKATRIYARNTIIKEISSSQAKEFFNNTHLQGFCGASYYIGLFYNNELVSALSIRKPRFNKKSQLEIIRMSSKLNTVVVGGMSKMISFIHNIHPNATIISYANRRWSKGNVYKQSNFILTGINSPCYFYTNGKNLWHRTSFTKSKLKDKLKTFDPALTEVENMYNNNYRRIWDCGHYRYVISPKDNK